jgi:hypothetical protein
LAAKSGGGGVGLDLGNLKEVLNEKVSMEMFNTLTVQKANKIDVEMCMRWVDLLHKMCNALANLTTLNFKTALDIKGNESMHAK